jgi:hypothetical protein
MKLQRLYFKLTFQMVLQYLWIILSIYLLSGPLTTSPVHGAGATSALRALAP